MYYVCHVAIVYVNLIKKLKKQIYDIFIVSGDNIAMGKSSRDTL